MKRRSCKPAIARRLKSCLRYTTGTIVEWPMSYLHCPACKCAFNIATHSTCPSCPVVATMVDGAEDIVAATEQLARAMARATPDERADAMGRMDRLALPAPGAKPVTFHGAMVRSIREALDPQPLPPPRKPPLFARMANRVADKVATKSAALLGQLTPHLGRYAPRALEMGNGLRARMRALTA